MSLWFSSNIDNTTFRKKISEMESSVRKMGGTVTSEANKMNVSFRKFYDTVAGIGAGIAGTELLKTIVQVRGEMQSLQLAYNTIIGDVEKGQKLMAETIQFAATTPFNLPQVASAAKQLLVYGVAAEDIITELTMLGDVAAGAKIPLGDLIYLYGTLKTQGRALAIDIRQFAGRGIPIYRELSEVMGVAERDMARYIAEGKVGFDQVQAAFQNMTREGGNFNNLMKDMSTTVSGRLSNLQDAIYVMWNNIGASQEGVIYTGIEGLHKLVENYETVIKILLQLVTVYGTYRATLLSVAAAEKAIAASKALMNNIQLIRIMRKELGLLNAVRQAFNITNPLAWVAGAVAGIAGIVVGTKLWKKEVDYLEDSIDNLAEANRKVDESYNIERNGVAELLRDVEDNNVATEERGKQLQKLKAIVPGYLGYLDEEGRLVNANTASVYDYLTAREKELKVAAYDETLRTLEKTQKVQKQTMEDAQEALRLRPILPKGTNFFADLFGIEGSEEAAFNAVEESVTKYEHTTKEIARITEERERIINQSSSVLTPPGLTFAERAKIDKEYADATLDTAKELRSAMQELRRSAIKDEEELILYEKRLLLEAIEEEKQAYIDLAIAAGKAKTPEEVDTSSFATRSAVAEAQANQDILTLREEAKAEEAELLKQKREDEEKIEAEARENLLEELATYEQKRLNIIKEFAEKRALMYADEAQTQFAEGFSQANVDILDRALNDALLELDTTSLEDLKVALGDVDRMARGTIVSSLQLLREKLKNITDPEIIETFIDQINKLQDALEEEFSPGLGNSFETAIRSYKQRLDIEKQIVEAQKEGSNISATRLAQLEDEAARSTQTMQDNLLGAGISTFIDSLNASVELMRELADTSGDVQLEELADKMEGVARIASSAGQGAVSGGWVGALVGGLTALIQEISQVSTIAKIEQAELQKNTQDFANAIANMAFEIDDAKWETVFGTDEAGKAVDALNIYYAALEKFKEYVNSPTNKPDIAEYIYPGGDNYGEDYNKALQAYEKELNKLQGSLVKTNDRSWLLNYLGIADEYTTLQDLAPELWDTDGMFNVTAAEAFLATNTQISAELRQQIENAIELSEAADTAKDAFQSFLQDTFGELGTGAIDAMTDAVMNQTDAWVTYGDTVGNVIRNVLEDISYQLFMAKDLNALESTLEGIYGNSDLTAEQRVDEINKALAEYYQNLPDNMAAGQKWWEEQKKLWEEQGINIFGSDATASREGMTGVQVNPASQDSVDEWNAKLTTVLVFLDWFHTDIRSISTYAKHTETYQKSMLSYMSDFKTYLLQIGTNTQYLKDDISEMKTVGIKLK